MTIYNFCFKKNTPDFTYVSSNNVRQMVYGEIISSNDGSPIHMVVQNQVIGTNTMTVYRCTSGRVTPLGWSGTTLPGTGKTLTGWYLELQ